MWLAVSAGPADPLIIPSPDRDRRSRWAATISSARDQMARDANENARLRAEIAAAKIKLAPLPAANLARDRAA